MSSENALDFYKENKPQDAINAEGKSIEDIILEVRREAEPFGLEPKYISKKYWYAGLGFIQITASPTESPYGREYVRISLKLNLETISKKDLEWELSIRSKPETAPASVPAPEAEKEENPSFNKSELELINAAVRNNGKYTNGHIQATAGIQSGKTEGHRLFQAAESLVKKGYFEKTHESVENDIGPKGGKSSFVTGNYRPTKKGMKLINKSRAANSPKSETAILSERGAEAIRARGGKAKAGDEINVYTSRIEQLIAEALSGGIGSEIESELNEIDRADLIPEAKKAFKEFALSYKWDEDEEYKSMLTSEHDDPAQTQSLRNMFKNLVMDHLSKLSLPFRKATNVKPLAKAFGYSVKEMRAGEHKEICWLVNKLEGKNIFPAEAMSERKPELYRKPSVSQSSPSPTERIQQAESMEKIAEVFKETFGD